MCLMDIATYLRQQKEQVSSRAKVIKDFSVFDFNHVPEQPVMREECKELIREMFNFEISGIPGHYAIIGARGSGKTLMLKYLQKVIPGQADLDVIYVNCRHQNTSFRIFAHLLVENTAGSSLGELYERFLLKYRRKAVVVLDEVDLMSPKDKRREILYMLSRSEQPYMVVMLANSAQVLKELDAATKSSLQPMPLHFKNYNAEQVYQIIRDRAEKGLHSWDEGQLREIAALTTRLTNADARVAIKTLKYAVLNPREGLQDCFDRARRDVVIDLICDLSDHALMILWATGTSRSDFAKEIYKRYCQLSRSQREKPFSYVHFYSNLSYLQSCGLVALVSTKVDRSYTNRVLLTFDKETVVSLCQLRFEK